MFMKLKESVKGELLMGKEKLLKFGWWKNFPGLQEKSSKVRCWRNETVLELVNSR